MNKPTYNLIVAVTIDGYIAAHTEQASDWTTPEDKQFLRAELDKSDCIVIGHTTYKVHEKRLAKRTCVVFTKSVSEPKTISPHLTYLNPEQTDITTYLSEHGLQHIAVLGGSQIYSYFLQNNLIDNLYLTIEPITFGKGVPLFSTPQSLEKKFRLLSTRCLNLTGTVLLHYQALQQ